MFVPIPILPWIQLSLISQLQFNVLFPFLNTPCIQFFLSSFPSNVIVRVSMPLAFTYLFSRNYQSSFHVSIFHGFILSLYSLHSGIPSLVSYSVAIQVNLPISRYSMHLIMSSSVVLNRSVAIQCSFPLPDTPWIQVSLLTRYQFNVLFPLLNTSFSCSLLSLS